MFAEKGAGNRIHSSSDSFELLLLMESPQIVLRQTLALKVARTDDATAFAGEVQNFLFGRCTHWSRRLALNRSSVDMHNYRRFIDAHSSNKGVLSVTTFLPAFVGM